MELEGGRSLPLSRPLDETLEYEVQFNLYEQKGQMTVYHVITPHTCARCKVIGHVIVVVVVVMDTKSPNLEIQAPDQVVGTTNNAECGEKLASVCSELSGTAYMRTQSYSL